MATHVLPAHPADTRVRKLRRRASYTPKVLQVGKFFPPHWGGMETHLHSLCTGLRRTTDISVLVSNNCHKTVEQVIDGVRVSRLGRISTIAGASICPGMALRIRFSEADIVHLHLPNPTATVAYLLGRRTGKLVVTYHSDVIRQRMLNVAFEPIQQLLLQNADAILVASPNYLESSISLQPHRSRCHVVPLGVPPRCFETPPEQQVADLRRQYGRRLILSVGRLVYYKGFEFLIRAMQKIDARLIIVGKGPLRKELVCLAASLGVADRVSFVGELSPTELHASYYASDLFVLPSVSRSEAFGLVQVEAMAARLPIVNTNLPSGVPFVSPHGLTGLTVPPRDCEALAAAINVLLESADLRVQYGQAARERATALFSSSVMTSTTERLYRSLLDED